MTFSFPPAPEPDPRLVRIHAEKQTLLERIAEVRRAGDVMAIEDTVKYQGLMESYSLLQFEEATIAQHPHADDFQQQALQWGRQKTLSAKAMKADMIKKVFLEIQRQQSQRERLLRL